MASWCIHSCEHILPMALRLLVSASAACLALSAFAPEARADGTLEWAVAMGGQEYDESLGIAVDGAGNVYTTGRFEDTADFGSFQLTSAGGWDIFVAKQASDGTFLWARSLGGSSSANGVDVAVDTAGNVYTTGYFLGTANFGQFQLTSAGVNDIFVCKLDANGDVLWARSMGGPGDDRARGIAVDAAGNVYTTGSFFGTADFDPAPTEFDLTSGGGWDIFVSKLDTNGGFVWARAMGGGGNDDGYGIAVDGAGNVYTTGRYRETVDFDPGPGTFELTSGGDEDVFVSKLDTSGGFIWARSMGGASSAEGHAIAIGPAGGVYTTGWFLGDADFDPGPGTFTLTWVGSFTTFVSKLNASGDFVWARALGATTSFGTHGIAVGPAGDVYTTGWFEGVSDFDPGPGTFNLTSLGSFDIFVSKLDTNGNFGWARSMGGSEADGGQSIAAGTSGAVYVSGLFAGTADFDPDPKSSFLTSAGSADAFVVRLHDTDAAEPGIAFDINLDGFVNAVDVQLVINAALGIAIAPLNADVNDSGSVNAVDVQLVINAALGIPVG